ncbi:hypothetical protein CDO52_24310 [Nocardiopsis gilva YIM 90087]|uniref:Uncharacterized protein n=1 Tax=Nocardiopsis gilva YIM 90087 TaxID=1235441 RepID=A0A223SBN5_9ACTN|nr:hypothetical protein [Nocardiopsis gilva]ASU85505.1 hypothetical protein CDO52_24310 [Nocardiopsis gilva YIM 90087]
MRLTPGRLLARLTIVPAVALAAWLLVAFPLLVVGQFTPLTGALLGGPAVIAALVFVPRWVPEPPEDDVPWWPVAAVVLITVAFAAVQLAYHGEALVIRRDPASYAQFTAWIAQHGSLPIPQDRDLIAGNDPAVGYGSLAYYEVGTDIWPQFLAGLPLILSVGYWIGDIPGMLLMAPLIGALGVLTFAGLAARLIGARWAPLAALILAVCQTQQWISRSTYSEIAAQVLMLGALALAFDASASKAPERASQPHALSRGTGLRDRWGATHALAGVAGLVFGLGLVVRIDAIRDLLPVVGFIALLLLARRSQALPMLAGLVLGLGYGFVAGFWLSKPYLDYLSDSLEPLLVLSAVVVVGAALATALLWRHGVPRTDRPSWLPTAVAVLAVLVVVALALRPLLFVQYGHGDEATGVYIGQVQEIEGLPVDPERTYEEMSLYWVSWYVGASTVLLATLGLAILLHRILRRREPRWVLPTMVLVWTVATTLLRPAITPDHPWASRRLIVLVIPAFILFAVWFVAWLARRFATELPASVGERPGAGRMAAAVVTAAGALVMLMPTAITAAGVMSYRSDIGTVAGTRDLCAALPEDASVLMVDGSAGNYMQLIRGMCGVPTARVLTDEVAVVDRVTAEIRERGRTPVLAASAPETLDRYVPSTTPKEHPFDVHSASDPSTLMEPPSGPWAFNGDVWIAVAG